MVCILDAARISDSTAIQDPQPDHQIFLLFISFYLCVCVRGGGGGGGGGEG